MVRVEELTTVYALVLVPADVALVEAGGVAVDVVVVVVVVVVVFPFLYLRLRPSFPSQKTTRSTRHPTIDLQFMSMVQLRHINVKHPAR